MSLKCYAQICTLWWDLSSDTYRYDARSSLILCKCSDWRPVCGLHKKIQLFMHDIKDLKNDAFRFLSTFSSTLRNRTLMSLLSLCTCRHSCKSGSIKSRPSPVLLNNMQHSHGIHRAGFWYFLLLSWKRNGVYCCSELTREPFEQIKSSAAVRRVTLMVPVQVPDLCFYWNWKSKQGRFFE